MKNLILVASLLASFVSLPAFAAKEFLCHATLLHPMEEARDYLWTPPMGFLVPFTYRAGTEKTQWLKIENAVPGENPTPQYSLKASDEKNGTIAVEFSKKSPFGDQIEKGDGFWLVIHEKRDWKNAPGMAVYDNLASLAARVEVTESLLGYVSVTCAKK